MGITKEVSLKNKNDVFQITSPKCTFADIILSSEVRDHIENFIVFYTKRDLIFREWGLQKHFSNKDGGILNFYGESGTGKTMAAHAVASVLNKKILQVNYADIESKYVGETAKNLQQMFQKAQTEKAVILFDEADALLSRRVTDMSSAADVSVNQTRSVLLTLLESYTGIVVFTTNFISNYDIAFMRRIQYHIRFSLPDLLMRKKLWEFYLDIKLPYKIDIEAISREFDTLSAADIANAVFQAVLTTAKKSEKILMESSLRDAIRYINESKSAQHENIKITRREVTEEYARHQLGGK